MGAVQRLVGHGIDATMNRHFISLGLILTIAEAAAASEPRRTEDHVVGAARTCGMQGVTIRRSGPRKFSVGWTPGTTTVTFHQAPLPAELERELDGRVKENLRRWDCLVRWGEQRRIRIEWALPDPIIYD